MSQNDDQRREAILEEYAAEKAAGGNWRTVADRYGEPVGSVRNFAVGVWTPKKPETRARFGLDPLVEVPGDVCPECGSVFVSNHPNRKKCFDCSPTRKRKDQRATNRELTAALRILEIENRGLRERVRDLEEKLADQTERLKHAYGVRQ